MSTPTTLTALAVLRDQHGRLLLTTPPDLNGLRLPGGPAAPGEPPHEVVARRLHALIGLPIRPTYLLAVDWTSDELTLLFDAGTVTAAPTVPPGVRLVHAADLPNAMSPAQAARLQQALLGPRLPLLLHGQRAG
ncbi:NUDIX domain-containing protein [Kitasatospora sp. NPDC054939]